MNKNNKQILVIHGPNLNMLGKRETEIYGSKTLEQIDLDLKIRGRELDLSVESFQSNYEGRIVEKIHNALDLDGLIINPAAYTHTSIAVRDAVVLLDFPVVEVHISNIYKRESFRHKSLIADLVMGRISGFGPYGYTLALEGIARVIQNQNGIFSKFEAVTHN